MTKHQQIFKAMMEENKGLFSEFDKVYHRYNLDPQSNQEEFNQVGGKVMETAKKYENRLCGKSEKGIYGKFSTSLADKFWDLIRKKYPKIDFVGVKVRLSPKEASIYDIPKIKL